MAGRMDKVKLKSAITVEKFRPGDHQIEEIITSDPNKPQSMVSQSIVGASYTYEDLVAKEKGSKSDQGKEVNNKGGFLGKKKK